jgi:hypothetical protein
LPTAQLTLSQETVHIAPPPQPMQEMKERRTRGPDLFFAAPRIKERPYSVYTEFMESDTEIEQGDDDHDDDSEVYSEFGDLEGIEEEVECSPRNSIGSVGHSTCARPRLFTYTAGCAVGATKLHHLVIL